MSFESRMEKITNLLNQSENKIYLDAFNPILESMSEIIKNKYATFDNNASQILDVFEKILKEGVTCEYNELLSSIVAKWKNDTFNCMDNKVGEHNDPKELLTNNLKRLQTLLKGASDSISKQLIDFLVNNIQCITMDMTSNGVDTLVNLFEKTFVGDDLIEAKKLLTFILNFFGYKEKVEEKINEEEEKIEKEENESESEENESEEGEDESEEGDDESEEESEDDENEEESEEENESEDDENEEHQDFNNNLPKEEVFKFLERCLDISSLYKVKFSNNKITVVFK